MNRLGRTLGTWRRRLHVARTLVGRGVVAATLEAARRLPPPTGSRVDSLLGRLPLGAAGALQLRRARVLRALAAGERHPDLDACVTALLAAADAAWDTGRVHTAAYRLEEALELVFHPSRHFGARAELAERPESVLGPLRRSVAYRALTRPSTEPSSRPRGELPAEARPRRVLFVSYGGWTFVRPLVERYRHMPGVTVHDLDLADLADPRWQPLQHDLVHARLRRAAGGPGIRPPRRLAALIGGADVVFVEWGHRQLAWMSLLDQRPRRLVARLHSYEAFTLMPHVVDWGHVDGLVFVAPHIRALTQATVPATRRTASTVIPNLTELGGYARPKRAGSQRTMALVGWSTVNKDPAWAVDVLELLLAADDGWRLLLVGHEPTDVPAAERPYFRRLDERLHRLGGAVVTTGYREDVPEVLRDVGVVLSTSRREGTHEALVQGAASGALPVVRDWPVVSRWGGPRGMVPDEWVVTTPAEAADRILTAPSTAAEDAQRWTIQHLDAQAVWPRLDAVIRHGGGS